MTDRAATPASPSGYLPGMKVGTGGNVLTPASPETPRIPRFGLQTLTGSIPASPPDTGAGHAAAVHEAWHADNPGLSCADDSRWLAEAGGPSR